jgi:hypothetical protein
LGIGDSSRDGERASTMTYGTRVDFGNAGQGGRKDFYGNHKPDVLVGLGVFDKLEEVERRTFKEMIGQICDSMQAAMDDIHAYLNTPRSYNDHERYLQYAHFVRQTLGAKQSRMEWITIQVKCLSRKDTTKFHLDKFNCQWHGYEKTAAYCGTVKDAHGDIWSVKILGNSRAKVGNYLEGYLGLKNVFQHITVYVDNVNKAYARQMNSYHGSYKWERRITCTNFFLFWLDNKCDYGTHDLIITTPCMATP